MSESNPIERSFEIAASRCEDLTPLVYRRLHGEYPETLTMFRTEGSEPVKGAMLALTIDVILDFAGPRTGHFRTIECEVFSHDAYSTPRRRPRRPPGAPHRRAKMRPPPPALRCSPFALSPCRDPRPPHPRCPDFFRHHRPDAARSAGSGMVARDRQGVAQPHRRDRGAGRPERASIITRAAERRRLGAHPIRARENSIRCRPSS